MAKIIMLPKGQPINGDYDEEADCLYLSFGQPRPAVGFDVDEFASVIVRFDENTGEVVGLTIIGLKSGIEDYKTRSNIW